MVSFISDDQYNIEVKKECQILVKNGATFPGIAIGIGQTNPSKILSALILESVHFEFQLEHYSCNNITTTLIQISCLFYFDFFSKSNNQMMN